MLIQTTGLKLPYFECTKTNLLMHRLLNLYLKLRAFELQLCDYNYTLDLDEL